MSFRVWRPGRQTDGICKILGVQGIEDSFELDEGVSRLAGWPDDAFCAMDPRYPKDIQLADSLYGAGVLVISGRAAATLDAETRDNRLELLPIRIVNHKGRSASDGYFIANPLAVCDCIDEPLSAAKRNPIDPESIVLCERLVLRHDNVPAELRVFRLEHWRDVVVVRTDFLDRVNDAKLSGFKLIDPDAYTGLV